MKTWVAKAKHDKKLVLISKSKLAGGQRMVTTTKCPKLYCRYQHIEEMVHKFIFSFAIVMQVCSENTPPTFTDKSPALAFNVHAKATHARAATLFLPHGKVRTPVFMPVGTKGTIKALSSHQLLEDELAPEIILGNTYHLASQPGTELIADLGGLHKFMNWSNNLLTDSGGFQMVSLLKLAEITERGVKFQSPVDGKEMMLTPEESIKCQNEIGADIMMQLDDVVSSVNEDVERFKEATARSVRWLDRCIAAHSRPREQNLFGIIQGGLDVEPGGLREQCLEEMLKRDLPGYAIGGLAGGESKVHFWKVVAHVRLFGHWLDVILCCGNNSHSHNVECLL